MRFSICVMLLSVLAASGQDRQTGTGANFYSRDKEVALGASLAQQIRGTTTPLNNPAALDFVQKMGARLAAQFPEPGFSFTFAVTASDQSNSLHEPLAVPGGYIFVPASLFLAAQDEGEFAGMLAHAMAHVQARHETRTATKEQLAQLTVLPLIFYGGWQGYGARQTATIIPLALVKFQDTFEREADLLAVKLTSAAGYDPGALLRYVTRVSANNPADPARDARIAAMESAIQRLAPANSADDFLRIQSQIRDLPRN